MSVPYFNGQTARKRRFVLQNCKVGILLFLCAIACSVNRKKEKERMRFINNFLIRRKQTLQNNLARLNSKEKETQEKLSKNDCYNFFSFRFVLFSRIHGNIGLN